MGRKNAIYKYTKLKYVCDSITHGIYASNITEMNDPYEYFQISNEDNFIFCSLTRSRNAKLMWAHYGDSHKGCLLKIKTPDEYNKDNFVLKDVIYSSKYFSRKSISESDIVNNLYIKDKKWSLEKEVRAVTRVDTLDENLWKKVIDEKVKYYFRVKVEEVIFGCSVENDEDYQKLLKTLKLYNDDKPKKDQIKVKKMKMSDSSFRFVEDKTFNYLDEIR